jgi:peptidyl-prolyl cis-trans isomerase B (cyclophilin B)
MMIRFLPLLLLFSVLITGSNAMADSKNPQVTLQTNQGTIVIELYSDKAPKTVANFLSYAKSGFFEGTIFHRVIPSFMIQGGGFTPEMNQKPTQAPIPIESNNGLKNELGTIAMARTMDPNSATAQFFINVKDNAFLNYSAPTMQGYGYAVFGKVVEGMDVVHKIEKVPTGSHGGHDDVPRTAVTIDKVSVTE